MTYWLVIDLEATTEEGGWPVEHMEIIEIGASLVDASGHEIDHFHHGHVRDRLEHLFLRNCHALSLHADTRLGSSANRLNGTGSVSPRLSTAGWPPRYERVFRVLR